MHINNPIDASGNGKIILKPEPKFVRIRIRTGSSVGLSIGLRSRRSLKTGCKGYFVTKSVKPNHAPVAHLDRVLASEAAGRLKLAVEAISH